MNNLYARATLDHNETLLLLKNVGPLLLFESTKLFNYTWETCSAFFVLNWEKIKTSNI